MYNFAATFDTQLSPVAPFLFYLVIGVIIFVETGLLIGFFLPGDSLLFSAGLVAAATKPALNNSESPGKKKPISKPVSTKIIPAITT